MRVGGKGARSCYRASHVDQITAISEKIAALDEGDPQGVVSETDLESFFQQMADPELQTILHQKEAWVRLLERVRAMVVAPSFERWQLFLDPRFCQAIPFVVGLLASTAPKSVILVLDILSQLFTFVQSLDSPIVSREIIVAILDATRSGSRDVQASAYFALANFVALGKECRDFLLESGIVSNLKRFLRTATGGDRGQCGLRLATNILSYGIADCWEEAECLIPVLRGNLMISDASSRRQAARCLVWIVQCEGGVERCCENDVPGKLYESIMNEREYQPDIFQLMNMFIDAECCDLFLHPEFIDAVHRLMMSKKASETHMIHIFNYLWKIMMWRAEYMVQSEFIAFLREMAAHGCHGNRVGALVSIFHFLQNAPPEVVRDIANDELLGVTIDIIDSLEDDDLEDVLCGITMFVDSRDEEVARVWRCPELIQALDSITTANDENSRKIQELVNNTLSLEPLDA